MKNLKGNEIARHSTKYKQDMQLLNSNILEECRMNDCQYEYIKKYAINFEIPSYIIQDSKFYTKDPRYVLQLVNYNIPGTGKETGEECYEASYERKQSIFE